ncbi:MAG: molybdopterin-dependent oxidoreductase [Deltaproteobacteria bacterium]|jgi:anaerobic selenocysteine-containing dehydrogenase|nr:molybdopterin-dependent oxidoreductase [Deltaproteobacteria bacterium]
MSDPRYAVCHLCEAMCGLQVTVEHDRVTAIRGDENDPFSGGHLCPKGVALQDVQHDPDRIREPIRRVGDNWRPVSWDDALDETADRIAEIQSLHGRDAFALYIGNPTAHSSNALLFGLPFRDLLASHNNYSSNSVDALPRLMTSFFLYGNQALIPVADLERTDFLLILGANPLVSNGSAMAAPDVKRRLAAIRARGGRVVVVDPRRTETADAADRHLFIRPGTDALLLASMIATIFEEDRAAPGRLATFTDGLDRLRGILAPFTAERVAAAVGIDAGSIRTLARDFAAARRAVCYSRMGACVQEFGALATWLTDALNIVTGNLDREGGWMFTTPAVDLAGVATLLGQRGSHDRWRSRVSGQKAFTSELPVAVFAEEMDTPGSGRIRGLLTHAGNPVLSLPNGARVERALAGLDFMVSIDIYRNETTRHARLILPPTWGLEHDHFPLLAQALAVRNVAHFSQAILPPPRGTRHDHEIFLGLTERLGRRRSGLTRLAAAAGVALARRLGPRGVLDWLVRLGPHGDRFRSGSAGLSLAKLLANPHGLDLGPLELRLPARLANRARRIDLVPAPMVEDLPRLAAKLEPDAAAVDADTLLLVSRRQLHSNNSWMHNSARLVKGRDRCTLLIHPRDAAGRNLGAGDRATIRSRVGAIEAPIEISDEMMPGVVCLPHGYGHDRAGDGLAVASAHPGVSINDVTDERLFDVVSGTTQLSGVPVTVARA